MASDPLRVDLTSPLPLPDQDRRAAALVALLVLEGPLPRSRMAGLLWPDVPEATARNNLSQTLRRMRQGQQFGVAGERLLHLLTPLSEADALALLSRHDYSDLVDLSDLLLALQERRLTARLRGLRAQLLRAREAGELQVALDLTAVLLDLDPLNETTHRAAMQLSHLLGDRAGALSAYHCCQAILKRELGLSPSGETVALAREIERSSPPLRQELKVLPVSVQRPPHLIGRDAAWTAMQRAWDAGQGIILSGEPGIGKTRLMRDFAAAHGRVAFFGGRPGDRLVPYSTHARTYRELLRQFPDLALPAWVRRELARIVPELGEAPPPLGSDADRLRFYQAKTETLLLAAAAGMQVLAFDDLQYVDEASVEAGEHSLSVFWGDGPGVGDAHLRTIHAYRSGELSAELEGRIEALVSAGLAVLIRLGPLDPAQAAELLESLEVTELHGQIAGLALASGGNPLALLESARNLLGSDGGRGMPRRLGELTRQRLERLSPAAVGLARAAAVLGTDTSPETVSRMLDLSPLELADPWRELEAAQVLSGSAFTHDLLQEAVVQGLPGALQALLHRRAAAALEAVQGMPARTAYHWQAGAEPGRAAPHYFAAAQRASEQFRLDEAATLYGQAVDAYAQTANPEAAIEALEQQSVALWETHDHEHHQATVERIDGLARTPRQRARARRLQARLHYHLRDWTAAALAARQGLDLVRGAASDELSVSLQEIVGLVHWKEGELVQAADVLGEVERGFGFLGLKAEQAGATNNLALVLDYQGRRGQAARRYAEAVRLFEELGQLDQQAIVLGSWGSNLSQGGRYAEALGVLREAFLLVLKLQGAPNVERRVRTQLGAVLTGLGQFREAEQQLRDALALAHQHGLIQSFIHARLGDLYGSLGRQGEALDHLALAAQGPSSTAELALIDLSEARLLALANRDASRPLERAVQRMTEGTPVSSRLRLRLAKMPYLAPDEAFREALAAVEEARAIEHGGLEAVAQVRAAQALLALGQPEQALTHVETGRELLGTYVALDLTWPEAELAYLDALAALADPSALPARQAARARLLSQAEEQLPPEHRTAFLTLPLHARLLGERDPGRVFWQPLTDRQWLSVQPILTPPDTGTGRPRRDTRAVLDGVLWALATGAAWNRPFPAHLPSAATCYRRFREWQASGALERVQSQLTQQARPSDF